LRPGFLKLLVAVLGAERRSVPADAIVRRARSPLFDPLIASPELHARTRRLMSWWSEEKEKASKTPPTVAEGLVVDGNLPSLLFAVTGPTTYKILDWGRDVGLSGRGNQISERGIILRALINSEAADAFMGGAVDAWNPFLLSDVERLFFLYHLLEIDRVSLRILDVVGEKGGDEPLEVGDASRILAVALQETLSEVEKSLRPPDIPAFRTATELAATIATEVGLLDPDEAFPVRRGPPKPVKPAARRSLVGGTGEARKTTKNADHQTVPRFEQFCDLGFVDKPGGENDLTARRRWRWSATDVARRWKAARDELDLPETRFLLEGFARSARHAYLGKPVGERCSETKTVAKYLADAYRTIRRPVGHTPLDSIALVGCCKAFHDGRAVELADFHQLMLTIKTGGYLDGEVFFASGNDYEKMFVLIRDDFVERVSATLPPDLATVSHRERHRS
jgi:hypothetical protein